MGKGFEDGRYCARRYAVCLEVSMSYYIHIVNSGTNVKTKKVAGRTTIIL